MTSVLHSSVCLVRNGHDGRTANTGFMQDGGPLQSHAGIETFFFPSLEAGFPPLFCFWIRPPSGGYCVPRTNEQSVPGTSVIGILLFTSPDSSGYGVPPPPLPISPRTPYKVSFSHRFLLNPHRW